MSQYLKQALTGLEPLLAQFYVACIMPLCNGESGNVWTIPSLQVTAQLNDVSGTCQRGLTGLLLPSPVPDADDAHARVFIQLARFTDRQLLFPQFYQQNAILSQLCLRLGSIFI